MFLRNGIMKLDACCFTGHRKINMIDSIKLKYSLKSTITRLIKNGVRNFYVGGALGFDMLAAECVVRLKIYYPDINLILVLLCKNHFKYWNDKDLKQYKKIEAFTDEIKYL